MAGAMYSFTLPLILLAVTGSPAQAGLLATLGLVARASVTLIGGAVVDRTDRARLMLIGGLCGALFTATLALASATGSLTATLLCVAHVLMELRSGFFGSTTNAALKDIVHPKQLGRAMAANQGRDSVLMLGSAPLAGVLLGLGASCALLLISALQLLAALTGFALGTPLRAAERATQERRDGVRAGITQPVKHGVRAGMKWCFSRPQLRSLLILITLINVGTNGLMTALTYGLQQRAEAPWVIGLVSTFMGLGMLAGSLIATPVMGKFRTGPLTCTCLSILGTAMVLMSLNTNLYWLGIMLFLAYFSVPALNAGVGGYFMAVIPQELAGRANSLITFMALAAMPLAPLLTGFGLQWVGMGQTLLFFGSLVAVSALAAWLSPHVRGIPHPDRWVEDSLQLQESAFSTEASLLQVSTSNSKGEETMFKNSKIQQRAGIGHSSSPRTFSTAERRHHEHYGPTDTFRAQRENQHSKLRNEQWIYL